MAKLTTKERNKLPAKSFAGPSRSYPVEDPSHARAALSRASANASPSVRAEVERAVAKKFPSIKQQGKRSK
jgi:hypothetical protein